MKPTTLKTLALIIASLCFTGVARSQSSTNELQVKAQASLLTDTNNPRLFLTVYLLNTSDHELTVLTKNLNLGIGGQPDDQMVLEVGYSGSVGYEGHPIIPSLYDFSPVTLRPNEQAFIRREITNGLETLGKRNDTPLVVRYLVSPEWGKRFGVWSGSIATIPFTASVRK